MAKIRQTLKSLRAHCDFVGECWIWRNIKDRPRINHGGKIVLVRRLVRELKTHSPIPDGMQVLAKCGNTKCVSPACSYLGTARKRCEDAAARGSYNLPMVRIKQAKARNDRSRITDEMVLAIRLAEGSTSTIGAQFGISKAYVSQIRRGVARVGYRTPFTGLGALNK